MEQQAPCPFQSTTMQDALGIVLQRTSSLTTLLNMMVASKQLREVVLGHCTGAAVVLLPSRSTNQQAKDFASWLAKYGSLAGELSISRPERNKWWNRLEVDIVAALKQAAAAPAGLRIHSCNLSGITVPNGVSILEQLPPSRVTSLDIHLRDYSDGDAALIDRVNSALGRLTALRDLSMSTGQGMDDFGMNTTEWYVTGLSSLTNLTSIALENIGNSAGEHLPVSLKEMRISRDPEWVVDNHFLQLGHLTAVTSLLTDSPSGIDETFNAGDVLPPNLLELEAADVRHAAVLLPLTKLQRLNLSASWMPAEELQQLSSLTALTDVQLNYHSSSSIDDAAAGWSALKGLHTLRLSHAPNGTRTALSTAAAAGLHKLSWLTELKISNLGLQDRLAAQDLGRALGGLAGLQALHLSLDNKQHQQQQQQQDDEAEWLEISNAQTLMPAIAALPALTGLTLAHVYMTSAAAVQLAAAAATLTSLDFHNCDISDAAVNTLVLRLPHLLSLNIHQQEKPRPRGFITDGVLPLLASKPDLDWSFTGVNYITRQGMQLFFPEE